jgi:Rps23 Pro-64 3,4-dihydroxylase Tpa1-like proline 4-hydroxylase
MSLVFRDPRYSDFATQLADRYLSADPFPHIVIDNFLPESFARELHAGFPDSQGTDWIRFKDNESLKLGSREAALDGPVRDALEQFNAAPTLSFVEQISGIQGLIPDPYFFGGGLHQIERGGFLKVHADFNTYERLHLDRRINLLVYLNPDWKEEYGGHLELWDREMTRPVQRILPIYNRCVIFSTTDHAYHGHPVPLTCPEGMTRKSIAMYYYTAGRPTNEQAAPHSTLYQMRPADRQRLTRWDQRALQIVADGMETAACIAHKPAALLRRIGNRLRPPSV